jgi:hydrogenase maturation protein HypF
VVAQRLLERELDVSRRNATMYDGAVERRALAITGVVQGVGFRPFVHGLASRLKLGGFVTNDAGGVQIEVEGDAHALAAFEHELTASAPPLARIESIGRRRIDLRGDRFFRIESSRSDGNRAIYVCPDVATCDACVRELFDPLNRRYRYPFINCTACGPRLTIVTGSPYDRERTTMAPFEMCEQCRAEYLDAANRRFHAEPIACADCGPRLHALDSHGHRVDGDPIETTRRALASGQVVAVKGLGGFHLACDARNPLAVTELRRRKHREEKPFAIMVRDAGAARALCTMAPSEAALLGSGARPIVLLDVGPDGAAIRDLVAPEASRLGLLLPYTPVHHLLMAAADGPLVMTSGNRSDEPIATDNEDARARLRGIADLFLVHDRTIRVRCDDSVVRQVGTAPIVLRRSRGYAPGPIRLPFSCRDPILAVGGQLKNTFAFGRDAQAFVSHHIGDLDDLTAFHAFERDIALYQRMFEVLPRSVAHDRHPDYASTRFALARPFASRVPVQHHHAHVASCMAEHGLTGPVIGVAWDGAGWGSDDSVWGGEFFVGDARAVERVAHLRSVAMPGGDRAAREPWRMALAYLHDCGLDARDVLRATGGTNAASAEHHAIVLQMIARRLNAPMTSSAGRLFDAVAALCGGRQVTTFEGQAAMWLESIAGTVAAEATYPFDVQQPDGGAIVVDTRPLVRAIVNERLCRVTPEVVARRFHSTLAVIIRTVCDTIRQRTGLCDIVLSGGVFLNGLLTAAVENRLAGDRFRVYRHRVVSPGDGGLSLGQLAVAAAQQER